MIKVDGYIRYYHKFREGGSKNWEYIEVGGH